MNNYICLQMPLTLTIDMLEATDEISDDDLSVENKNTNPGERVRTLNSMVEMRRIELLTS